MSSILTICEKMSTRWPSALSFGSSLSSSTYLPLACAGEGGGATVWRGREGNITQSVYLGGYHHPECV